MTDDEFTDVLSIGNTLPGPIATKITAGYIGYRVGGWLGMITALIATILPTVVALIIFLTVLRQYKDLRFYRRHDEWRCTDRWCHDGGTTWEFLKKSKKALEWKVGLTILVVSFVAIIILGVNAGIIIGGLLF